MFKKAGGLSDNLIFTPLQYKDIIILQCVSSVCLWRWNEHKLVNPINKFILLLIVAG